MKKNILFVVVLVVIVACLVACNSTGVAEPAASETALSEQVSEVASEEMSSEEVSEEASSEEVVEDTADYSADAIMKLVEELTVKYPYNNPEHIKALVIAANLDYITAEDLDTLLTTYGYSMDDLATLYDECIMDNGQSAYDTFYYYKGMAELTPEQDYTKRITLQSVCLNEEDSKEAKWFDEWLTEYATAKLLYKRECEVYDVFEDPSVNVEEFNSFKKTCYSYTVGISLLSSDYVNYVPNAYMSNQKVNGK